MASYDSLHSHEKLLLRQTEGFFVVLSPLDVQMQCLPYQFIVANLSIIYTKFIQICIVKTRVADPDWIQIQEGKNDQQK